MLMYGDVCRYNEALALYGEALRHEPKHADSLLSLAKLHMDRQVRGLLALQVQKYTY
jgi:hypothetical protein